MKILKYSLIVAFAAGCAIAQTIAPKEPAWKATVTVLDEANHPVVNSEVEMSYYITPPPGQTVAGGSVRGLTDTNGVCQLSHDNTGSIGLGFRATKTGYYPASASHEFADFKQQDPTKWNPSVTLLLKKIGKPIPMYAKSPNLGMPVFDKPVGYDLMIGDWVAPFGKGISQDILFTAHRERRAEDDADYRLVVSFPNLGDGIQEFSVSDTTSALKSPSEAPEDGYKSEWIQTTTRRPHQPMDSNRDRNRNYFFRVRTVQDENKKIRSALYGKIYGDFLQFSYYLNPTPNSRNVEFDPTKNLMKNLGPAEGISQP
jgi:hypothetical protein